MKKLSTILLISMLGMQLVSAQTNVKYVEAMQKGMALLEKSKTSIDFNEAANQFTRISSVEKTNWLPKYYSAYTTLLAGIFEEENEAKDLLFIKALALTEEADVLSPNNSEVHTLKGYVQFMTMTVDPTTRAATAIPLAMASLGKARKIDPTNPRPDFVQGQNTFYTPEYFGGGPTLAKPLLSSAAEKYEKQTVAADSFAPQWGKDRCLMLLKECK